MDDYDVFLNHRGPDVKGGFVAHLHDALRSTGLNPFLDKTSLVKENPAFTSIDDALEVAKVHIAVVSRGYAESKYCLSELAAMMRSGKPVIPVLYNVEPAELRRVEKGPFAAAFQKHKSRETAERVEEWADALRKLADITALVFRLSDYKGDEAELKREVVDAVTSLMPLHVELQVQGHVFGLEEQVKICMHKVETMSNATSVLGLVGTGGIGKTTLASEIYNRCIHQRRFHAMSFLKIDHSTPSSIEVGSSLLSKLEHQLLWDLMRIPYGRPQSYKYWFHKLSNQGRVLIVLDGIQDKFIFDNLILNTSSLAPGSCIIVTSRDHQLLKLNARNSSFYLHEVTLLGCEDSQKLFNWYAFHDQDAPKNLKPLASDVSKACGGLPLTLKVVGSTLFGKYSDEDQTSIWLEAMEALKGDVDVSRALKWSYDCLSPDEKLMFVDIACLLCGWKKDEAMKIWQSCKDCSSCCGIKTPHTSLRNLIDKSFLTLDEPSLGGILAMHGLLREMGQDIGMGDRSHLWMEGATIVLAKDKTHTSNKVRAINLANSGKHNFGFEDIARMENLHILILGGCDLSGNFEGISKELQDLLRSQMPLRNVPSMLDHSMLFNQIDDYNLQIGDHDHTLLDNSGPKSDGVYRRKVKNKLGTHEKYEPRLKREGLKQSLSLGQYDTHAEAMTVRAIATFFYDNNQSGRLDFEDGRFISVEPSPNEDPSRYFVIPPLIENKEGKELKSKLVSCMAKELFKQFKKKQAEYRNCQDRWIASMTEGNEVEVPRRDDVVSAEGHLVIWRPGHLEARPFDLTETQLQQPRYTGQVGNAAVGTIMLDNSESTLVDATNSCIPLLDCYDMLESSMKGAPTLSGDDSQRGELPGSHTLAYDAEAGPSTGPGPFPNYITPASGFDFNPGNQVEALLQQVNTSQQEKESVEQQFLNALQQDKLELKQEKQELKQENLELKRKFSELEAQLLEKQTQYSNLERKFREHILCCSGEKRPSKKRGGV
ncbi:hypothetical protein M758_5G135300 [Ceratodon purpureus]|nr:hypothetical protein M758_5G135300 [Ceratodon purpureus]